MNFVCGTCGHVVLEGDAPDKCPVCNSPKEVFAEKDAINAVTDPSNLSELEKKHLPVLKVSKTCGLLEGCQDVHAAMGEIEHPMEEDHFIVFIDFYLDKKWVSRAHLSPACKPGSGLHLKEGSGKLTAIELCNKHGYWLSEADL